MCKKILLGITKHHYEIVAIVAIVSLLVNVGMTTWNINTNNNSTDLNTRPYLSVDMDKPKTIITKEDVFYGNNIILKNNGKIPASHVSTHYYITTDVDKKNMHGLEWFKSNIGGFGATSFINAGSVEAEPGFRSLSPGAQYYYFEALTSYEGVRPNKKYWTHIKKVFYIDRGRNDFYPVNIYGEWDRNKIFDPPALSTEEEVVKLLETIRSNLKKK